MYAARPAGVAVRLGASCGAAAMVFGRSAEVLLATVSGAAAAARVVAADVAEQSQPCAVAADPTRPRPAQTTTKRGATGATHQAVGMRAGARSTFRASASKEDAKA